MPEPDLRGFSDPIREIVRRQLAEQNAPQRYFPNDARKICLEHNNQLLNGKTLSGAEWATIYGWPHRVWDHEGHMILGYRDDYEGQIWESEILLSNDGGGFGVCWSEISSIQLTPDPDSRFYRYIPGAPLPPPATPAAPPPTETESPIEQTLLGALRAQIQGRPVVVQPQLQVDRYRLDFAVMSPQAAIAVECDGHDYHSSKEQRGRDAKRDRYLQGLGFRVLRFTGSEIHASASSCAAEVLRLCCPLS